MKLSSKTISRARNTRYLLYFLQRPDAIPPVRVLTHCREQIERWGVRVSIGGKRSWTPTKQLIVLKNEVMSRSLVNYTGAMVHETAHQLGWREDLSIAKYVFSPSLRWLSEFTAYLNELYAYVAMGEHVDTLMQRINWIADNIHERKGLWPLDKKHTKMVTRMELTDLVLARLSEIPAPPPPIDMRKYRKG